MQVTETSAEGLKRAYSIIVEAKDIEGRIDARINEISRTADLPGFRPGKVPISLLKQRYGDAVMGEVLEELVNSGTTQALSDNELKPALQPKIEVTKFEKGEDLEYTVEVEVMPVIEATDFSKLKIDRMKAEAGDTEVQDAIQRLADAQKTFVAEEGRKAEDGDTVVIDFVGSIDGVEFEGGKAEDYNIELGSGSFIPGFEPQLVGHKAGEHVKVEVSFPEQYGAAELAGKEASFEVDVKEVKRAEAAEINDAMAERMGLENLEALTTAIKEQMASDYDGLARTRMKRELLDMLAEEHVFDVPEGMIEQEFGDIWKQVEQQKAAGNADEDDTDKSEDELKEEYRDIAKRRIRLGLLLSDVGEKNNIEVHQDEVNRAMAEQARQFQGQERQIVEYYQKNPEAMASLRAPIFEDKVVDFILEMATVNEVKVTPDQLMAEPEEKTEKKKPAKKKAAAKKKPAKKAAADETEADDKPAKKKPAAKKKAAAKKDES